MNPRRIASLMLVLPLLSCVSCGFFDDDDRDEPPKRVVRGMTLGGFGKSNAKDGSVSRVDKISRKTSGSSKAINLLQSSIALKDSFVIEPGPDLGVRVGPDAALTMLPGRKALLTGGFDLTPDDYAAHAFLIDIDNDSVERLPDMTVIRGSHTSTLLQDGRVLIAGGADTAFKPIAAAEIFDPQTKSFIAIDPMNGPRAGHKAVLLDDGKVLLTSNDFGSGFGCELFDPATNKFTATGSMLEQARVAVKLNDGRVLLIGAFEKLTAQIYDPVAGTFSQIADMVNEHSVFPTGTLLADGRVLICGGNAERDSTAKTDIFDPVTNTFASGPVMTTARNNHQALLMADGAVLLLGGISDEGDFLDSAEVFDPVSNAFVAIDAVMDAQRSDFASGSFID